MKNIWLALMSAWLLCCACGPDGRTGGPFSDQAIDRCIRSGEYARAEQMIRSELSAAGLDPLRAYDLRFRLEVMDRIRLDFSKTDSSVLAFIRQYCPEVSPEEIAAWEASGALECKTIDGQKRYFNNAARNLFRIDSAAQSRSDIRGRQSAQLDTFLAGYLPETVRQARAAARTAPRSGPAGLPLRPVKMKIRYTLTVAPDQVPDGEIIRAWLPYPRTTPRHSDVQLLSVSQDRYIIAPDTCPHRSLYMEQRAAAGQPAVFQYELRYTGWNQWFRFEPEDLLPYDTGSEPYRRYTAERPPHIRFTPDIRRIADSIAGGEQNPYLKVKRIFSYIADRYPWASAREYSTLENIPQYVLENRHGDCGQVSLLFITLARCAGIPAKWQSGWMMHPGLVNLHDWAEVYYEGIGWVPVDQSFGYVQSDDPEVHYFFTRGLDPYRYIVNDDFSADFYPAKIHPRSETVDFQRGEAEWKGGNLYFDRWDYRMEVEYE